MTRPSPPTSRVVGILEALAGDPESPLTVTDLARRLNLSVATCHAVVTSLVDSGYLSRTPRGKRYALGPRLISVGVAAQRSVLPDERVREELQELSRRSGCLCSIRAHMNDEIVVVDHVGTSDHPIRERVGDRYPFAPPFGLSFVIWGDDDLGRRWTSRAPVQPSSADSRRLARLVTCSRGRGYAVHKLLSGARQQLHAALVAANDDDLRDEPLRGLITEVLKAAWIGAYMLDDLDPADPVSVSTISAPVRTNGDATWIIELHLNRSDIALEEVEGYGRHLAAAGG